jgi:non-canonical purine NTP pyrophosphatase (RdgB/HAM1 family)
LEAHELDLDEIQSTDLAEIITDKVKRAYAHLNKPVMVEDVSAGLDAWQGLPGPFIKFFNKTLGNDALHQLGGDQAPVTVICTIGYYDGETLIIGSGEVKGHVVSKRGDNGFGFDSVLIPVGHDRTFAEMETAEKDSLSHRGNAVRNLLEQLEQLS